MKDCFKEEYPHLRSDEEVYFSWWLDDMREEGLIVEEKYEEVKYTIFDKVDLEWEVQMKTKTKMKKYNILHAGTYTPDWVLTFDKRVMGIITGGAPAPEKEKPFFTFCEFEDFTDLPTVVLDVKGDRGGRQKNASEHTYPFKQKMMWTRFRIYVHTVRIPELFAATFTPHRYFFTDESGAKRKISKWKPRTLQELLASREVKQKEDIDGLQKSLFS